MEDALTLEEWDRLSEREREGRAVRLAAQLPAGFAYRALTWHHLDDQQHQMAEFVYEGDTFVFLPGGTVRLGYDPTRAWEPTPEELESWQDTAEEYGLEGSIQEHIAQVTQGPRSASLAPLLVEARARELGWEPVSQPGSRIQEMMRRYIQRSSSGGFIIRQEGDVSFRVRRDPTGTMVAERRDAVTQGEMAARLAKAGFRFPTSDEWEYACGGGTSTLFRWGDHVPCDRYPTDGPERVTGREEAGYSPRSFPPDWDLHRRPNAFGLYIASDPYRNELVAEYGMTRGGDGGSTICGGAGFFLGWLPLATAYFEEDACKFNLDEPLEVGYTLGRRVLPLG